MKNFNLIIKTRYLKLKKFNIRDFDNYLDLDEREIILNTIDENIQFKNLRHNAFNFNYAKITFNFDEETTVRLPKCIAYISVIIEKKYFDLYVVFRSLNYDTNFDFDMTTLRLLCESLMKKLDLKCNDINIVFNNLHSNNNIKNEIHKCL